MFAKTVAAGVAVLDMVRPGWWRSVNLYRLRMDTCGTCIVGQVAGPGAEALGIEALGLDRYEYSADGSLWPAALGFNIPDGDDWQDTYDTEDEAYRALAAEWGRAVRTKRAADAAAGVQPS